LTQQLSALGIENRRDATEQRAAGIGGEFGVGDLAGLFSGAERFALEKAVRIVNAPGPEGEAMEHGETVEPMIIGPLAHLEFRGSGAE